MIMILFLIRTGFSQNEDISFIKNIDNNKLHDFLYDCSLDYKWIKLSFNPENYPEDGFLQTIKYVTVVDSLLLNILKEYTIDDFFYPAYYYLNMCHYVDSCTQFNFDLIVIKHIPSPASIDNCIGFFTYKSGCFFFQSGFEDLIVITEDVKIFRIDKYPIIYVDAEYPIDYFLYKDRRFYKYSNR